MFNLEFDAIPGGASMDGLIGLSSNAAGAFSDLACAVRFFTNNKIEARNAGTYVSVTNTDYIPKTSYHFKMVVNVALHKYDVYVTPAGGTEVIIGKDYAFRTEQASITTLGNFAITTSICGLTISNVSLSGIASSVYNDFESNAEFEIFPNPLIEAGELTIDFKKNIQKANIEITNLEGKVFYKQLIENASKVNLTTNYLLQKGFYVVRLSDVVNVYNKKLVVK